MRKVLLVVMVICLCCGFAATNARSEGIVLKAVTHVPGSVLFSGSVQQFVDRVNKRSQGRLAIDWLGGPEVILGFDQIHALKAGTIDMILYYPFGYMAGLMPEAYCKGLSELYAWEERKSGAYKLWSELFQKTVNAKYLGSMESGLRFYIYSKKKIEKIGDFKGMRIRGMPLYQPFLEALGATATTIPLPDTYTSLERGVVDGAMFPKFGVTAFGWQEVVKYVLNDGVFQTEAATMINLDKWNKIPKDLQEIMTDTMIDMEYISTLICKLVEDKKEDVVLQEAGVELLHLSPEDADQYRRLAYETTWEFVLQKAPENGRKLRELSSEGALAKRSFPWR